MSAVSILSLVWMAVSAVVVGTIVVGVFASFREIFGTLGRGFRALFRAIFVRASAVKKSLESAVEELEKSEQGSVELEMSEENPGVVDLVVEKNEEILVEEGPQLTEKQRRQLESLRTEALQAKDKWKYDFFEKKLIEGLAIEPENVDFLKMLADLYFSIGQMKKAMPILKRLIDREPENHRALWQLAEIHIGKSEFHTAELLLQRVVALMGNNPKYLISMIDVLYNTGRKYDAALLLEKVVKLRPTNISYLMAVGDLYDEIEMRDMAAKFYEKILEIEPTHAKAKQKLQKMSDF